ncbi:transglutaminase-like domain-containing protein [Teredinibacter turnerae]|uniref:transglutaminase-like domain-containing protein n=1 Tax=Teredinibacter turnerae TaxID=2426 RepID=UPI00035CA8F2|nr:transglutaminase-like domain-containing protein [Teredinibacter turnerae]
MSKPQEQGLSLTSIIRTARKSLRVFTWCISALLLNAVMVPDIFAIQDGLEKERQAQKIVLQGTDTQKLNQALAKIQTLSAEKQAIISQRIQEESGFLDDVLELFGLSQLTLEDINGLQQLHGMLNDLHQKALAEFENTRTALQQKEVSDTILSRHQQAQAQYQQRYSALLNHLQQLLTAESLQAQGEAIDELNQLIAPQQLKKQHTPTDPNSLPWGVPDATKTRAPADNADDLSAHTGIRQEPQSTYLAANVIAPELLGQPGGPVAEDLGQTPDIQLTEAIKAKAQELNDDPVEIYNWVRNNIEYIPSYGSIQGAAYTLETGKGNAFDTTSLLIALLRAANIPARYAYGTVDIPADKVMNWVGGVDNAQAAMQLLGQGGIPNTGMATGGKITHIRMETVWAEAWIDYFPSRGAKHLRGDAWIPLDASFKQYDYTEGEDLQSSVPFDAEGLVNTLNENITTDDNEGWVQGVDQAAVETALNDYQQQIEDYISQQNPEATVGDILGTQKIIKTEYRQLAAGLPYTLVARSYNTAELPDNLRHKFRYTLSSPNSSNTISFERPLTELAGSKLTLSFTPATEEDEALIASYLPEPDPDTGEIDPASLPNSLPGYLINLTAEFSQDGQVLDSIEAGTMGSELNEQLALWSPMHGWRSTTNYPIAGEYRAIGLDLQGANPEDSQRLQAQVEATKAKLESQDETQIATLTKNELVGDLLYATIYSYMALNDVQDQIQSKAADIVTYRLPSYGIFSTSLETSYWFGIARDVNFSGLSMDVDHLETQTNSKDNDREKRINFVGAQGARASAMEHSVPEQMFSTEDAPAQGISAAKALAMASAQGQKIWTIDQSNLSVALNSVNLNNNIEMEIRNAVNAGKIATVHESPVAFAGTTTVGYILLDPETGAGAYKIGTGENGALLMIVGLASLLMIGAILISTGGVGILAAGPAIFSAVAIALGNVFRGLSLILRATGNNSAAAIFCNLATYSYTAGAFMLIGIHRLFARILANIWANFAAGALAATFLTPVCS